MRNRKGVIAVVLALQLAFAAVAYACPYCKYNFNGWGFCRYYNSVGYYDCKDYVADTFNGRTDCSTCGYCNWSAPYENQPCNAGNPRDPLDPVASQNDGPCGLSMKARVQLASLGDGSNLLWVGMPVDEIQIF